MSVGSLAVAQRQSKAELEFQSGLTCRPNTATIIPKLLRPRFLES